MANLDNLTKQIALLPDDDFKLLFQWLEGERARRKEARKTKELHTEWPSGAQVAFFIAGGPDAPKCGPYEGRIHRHTNKNVVVYVPSRAVLTPTPSHHPENMGYGYFLVSLEQLQAGRSRFTMELVTKAETATRE